MHISLLLALSLCAVGVCAQALPPGEEESQRQRAQVLIEEAIGLGVPLYNSGQAAACAAVYQVALRSLQLFAPTVSETQLVINALRTAANQDPERRAWTLRYALDAIGQTGGNSVSAQPFSIEFSAAEGDAWYALNDGVMGGLSRGRLATTKQGTGEFSGQLSLRNNGGFSSVRARINSGALAGYDGLEIRVRGDERLYSLLASATDANGAWQSAFKASAQWQIVLILFRDMQLSIRGWRPAVSPPLSGERIDTIGFLIGDKDERPFRLEVDWMRGYLAEEATE